MKAVSDRTCFTYNKQTVSRVQILFRGWNKGAYDCEAIEDALAEAHEGGVLLGGELVEGRGRHDVVAVAPAFGGGSAHHALVSCVHETCVHASLLI